MNSPFNKVLIYRNTKIIKTPENLIICESPETYNPLLDNDLDNLYRMLSCFIFDNNILCMNGLNVKAEYEYVNNNNLTSNILDIKRYSSSYLNVVNKLTSLKGVKLKSLCNLITKSAKIENNNLYKYIDI